jgi:hypothetical protein
MLTSFGMRYFFLALFVFAGSQVIAQYNKGVLIGANVDLIKSDYDGYFQKVQVGMEANFFLSEKISATGGLEVWSDTGVSAVMGARWYATRDAFIRARGMIGKMDDFSIGAGWAKPVTETIRFESMTDFYFAGTFSIRAGFAMIIK